MDRNSTIYVADTNNHRVQQWLPNATAGITVAGVTGVMGSNGSLLTYPRAVYGDTQQSLYIADNYGISVWPLGTSVGTRVPGSTGFSNIYALFVDNDSNLYATNYLDCSVRMWTPTATASTIVAGGNGCGFSSSQLYYNYGMTVDSLARTIYVANSNARTVIAWPIGSSVGTIVAGWNNTYGTADFLLNFPRDVKRDHCGNLYVSDSGNNRVLFFCQNSPTMNGRIIAGYQANYPTSIALDSNLNLYVLELYDYTVKKYTRVV